MTAQYLYRGGMLCLSLAVMALSAHLLLAPEANDDWHSVVFILLLAAFALFNFHEAEKQDR